MKDNNYPNWLVPLEIAEKLKEIGFNLNCYFYREEGRNGTDLIKSPFSLSQGALRNYNNSYYDTSTSVPTWEQVLEWFRKKGLFGYVDKLTLVKNKEVYKFYVKGINNIISDAFNSYEEAREALVKALIQPYKSEQL